MIAIGISKGSSGYTCKVPISAVSESGVPPEQGDQLSYSVEGTVESVSGDTATIKIDSINGEPIAEEGSESPTEEAAEPETGTDTGSNPGVPSGGPPSEGLAAMRKRLLKQAKGSPLIG